MEMAVLFHVDIYEAGGTQNLSVGLNPRQARAHEASKSPDTKTQGYLTPSNYLHLQNLVSPT